jgi:uncharacterized protein
MEYFMVEEREQKNNFLYACEQRNKRFFIFIMLGIVIAIGNMFCGWFIAKGLYNIKIGDRYVSVKGLSEKPVKADLAIWNIGFKAANDNLSIASEKINNDQKTILQFLTAHGLSSSEIELQQTSVIDQQATEYSSGNKAPTRYIISAAVQVRTDKIELIRQLSAATGELIGKGIVLVGKDYGANPRYLFTKLDSIRPKMMEEATESARLVADQFAINSHTHLGSIKRASQGVFQVLSGDKSSSTDDAEQEKNVNKIIRLVTSVDYFLR